MTSPTVPAAQRLVLMNPGPVLADERVRAALGGPDLCHRESEFAELMGRVRTRVTQVCGGTKEFTSIVLTGSGTSAVEALIASVPPADSGVLAIDNGHYGRRMHDIAVIHRITVHHLELGWGVPIDLASVEAALAADTSLGFVTVVHHETSTGMLNDIAAVARVAHRYGRKVIVDAVSSVGAEPLDIVGDGLDWVAGSANKNLEGMPGLGFVCARHDAFAALGPEPRRTYSLDLHRHYTAQEHAQAPAFTPGVPAFYAFDAALELMLAEGVAARGKRYQALAERLRQGLEDLGLRLLLPPEHRSLGLTAVRLPQGVGYPELHRALRAEGFVIYAAQEQLARDFFRLSTMGRMTEQDIEGFLAALGRFLGTTVERTEHVTADREGK